MSELIQNDAEKQQKLREIVGRINAGSDVKAVKRDFDKLIRNVSPEEIASLEQGLISEGVPVEQVQELCDLHVSVFQSALERQPSGKVLPGHPVQTYRDENKVARKKAKALVRAARRHRKDPQAFRDAFEDLKQIELHYQRKENQLFPYLEGVDFTGPSKVMWGKHDEIRTQFKEVETADKPLAAARKLAGAIRRMIFMEERILFPTALRKLPESAWVQMRRGEAEIGYSWIQPGNLWDSNVVGATGSGTPSGQPAPAATGPAPATSGSATAGGATSAGATAGDSGGAGTHGIPLDVGELLPEQVNLMLKVLPFDMTFVDERNKVRYYSGGEERIFPRSPGIIGRDVSNCHPPKSVHVVERIISSFRKGEESSAEFWLSIKDRFVHIRYFAVYDSNGNYRGTVELTQDVTDIRALAGEQRLLDWDS